MLEDRALNNKSANYGVGSIEKCAAFCDGFNYFGLENGNECRQRDPTYIFSGLIENRLLRKRNFERSSASRLPERVSIETGLGRERCADDM